MEKKLNIRCLLLFPLLVVPVAVMAQRDSVMFGVASYYHSKFNGRKTSNGEIFRNDSLTAAHKNLPFGTRVKVTNLTNDSSVIVRINDRLPQNSKRSIDLSQEAARRLNMMKAGIVKAKIEIIPSDVTKVSPKFPEYLLKRNGKKITPDAITLLKNNAWKLTSITDTLNGVLSDYKGVGLVYLEYRDSSIYNIKEFKNIKSGSWQILDSMIILHEQAKEGNEDNTVYYNLKGPFLIYHINEDTLRLGKPLTSNGTWHRTYHFTRDRKVIFTEQQQKEHDAMLDRKVIFTEQQQKEHDAMVKLRIDSLYSNYPEGISKEEKRVGGCMVQCIVIKENSSTTVYEKKAWDWGGVFYFRNEISISQEKYEKETGIK